MHRQYPNCFHQLHQVSPSSIMSSLWQVLGWSPPPMQSGISTPSPVTWPPTDLDRTRTFATDPIISSGSIPSASEKFTSNGRNTFLWSTRLGPEGFVPQDGTMKLTDEMRSKFEPGEEVWFLVEEGDQHEHRPIIIPIHPSLCSDQQRDRFGDPTGGMTTDYFRQRLHAEFDMDSCKNDRGSDALSIPLDRLARHEFGTVIPSSKARVRGITTSAWSHDMPDESPTVHPIHGSMDEKCGHDRYVRVYSQIHMSKPWQKVDFQAEREHLERHGK